MKKPKKKVKPKAHAKDEPTPAASVEGCMQTRAGKRAYPRA